MNDLLLLEVTLLEKVVEDDLEGKRKEEKTKD
jgi:hypothetical protein